MDLIAEVEINEELAKVPLKEMVEFWSDGEYRLNRREGNYAHAFCEMLVDYLLKNGRLPKGEGWYPLDGSQGIKILTWHAYGFDMDNLEIETA